MSVLAPREAVKPACLASLFGGFRLLRTDGNEIAIANRRARVVLAMLCVQAGQPIDRDTLSRLLWPGRFEAHAKASLRQCLLDLGKLLAPLGANILDVTRSTVALNPTMIQTDYSDLEDALARNDDLRAIEMLSGIGTQPLLDHIDFGDAFDRWLTKCRSDAEKRLGVAVEQSLTALREAGDSSAHGRLLAAWSARHPDARRSTAPSKLDDKIRIAVLPFQSIGAEQGQGYFTDGMVDELITALGHVPQLLVTGRTSSFHFRHSDLPPAKIAAELGVSHLIEGSVQRQGELVRIHAHLIEGEMGFELWSERFDGRLDDVFALQERVGQAITTAIGSALGISVQHPQMRDLTPSRAAYDLYLQGRKLSFDMFADGALHTAVTLLDQAVTFDPGFAEAWLLLGEVHQLIGIYTACLDRPAASSQMAECIGKALAIKPELGQAHALLGLHELTQGNFVGALDLAHKGYRAEPNNPAVAMRLGSYLMFCGRTEDGMKYIEQAIAQDPVDGRKYTLRSAGLLCRGDITGAIADGQRAVDLGFASVWLAVASAAAGQHERAVEQYMQTRLLVNKTIFPPAGTAPMTPEVMDAYWLVAAKGVCSGVAEDRETYCRTLDYLHMTMYENGDLSISAPAVFMGYADLLFKMLGQRITLGNFGCLMSIWADIDPIRQIWQHPEFVPFAQRIGLAAAWDKYGWPDLLPVSGNR